jgi:hypothetical protein
MPQQGKHFPVRFFEAAKVDGVKHVAVDNQAARRRVTGADFLEHVFQETTQPPGLAVFAAQMDVGDNHGIQRRTIQLVTPTLQTITDVTWEGWPSSIASRQDHSRSAIRG